MSGAITDTSFDHRHVGTGAQEWSATGLIDNASVLDLVGLRRLIVVAAHPDDESLGAGGLIATAARRGVPVTVVVATTGEASHPQSPTLRPAQLAPIRRAEVLAAVHRLAPQAMVVQLDLGDSRLGASVDALAGEIRSVIDGVVDHAVAADGAASAPAGGDEVWLAAPWRHDRHADHAAAAEAARLVAAATGCRLLEFPLWAWHWGRPTDSPFADHPLLALELSEEVVRAKDLAMSEHRSQTEPLSAAAGDEPVVGPAFAEHFGRSREMFIDGTPTSLDRPFFDDFYSGGPDPWGFESRWYEKRKRALTIASLPKERFAAAFEPGCAIGVLTAELAERCESLLATDISALPLQQARRRLAGFPGVRFEQLQVPQEWPDGHFDLIVLSEIGYYCGPADLSRLIRSAVASLTTDGVLVACHWRHPVAEYPISGDAVHRQLRAESGLAVLSEHAEEDFLLDVLVRPPVRSVARRDGLLG